jgi:general stress protein YciG
MAGIQNNKSARGFAAMDARRQREIASKGGQSVPDEKRSFSQDPSLAAAAGRKGGQSVPAEKRSFSQDPSLAAAAGRKGGQVSGSHRSQLRGVTIADGRVQVEPTEVVTQGSTATAPVAERKFVTTPSSTR